jgi:hypothetical protein
MVFMYTVSGMAGQMGEGNLRYWAVRRVLLGVRGRCKRWLSGSCRVMESSDVNTKLD